MTTPSSPPTPPATQSTIESPDTKLARQRAKDRTVQRVRKIEALAKACGNPELDGQVSFGLGHEYGGVAYPIKGAQCQRLAAAMLEDALKEHDADPHAGELPKDLQWVHEAVSAAKPKSPSMTPPTPPKKEMVKTPVKKSSSPKGDD